MSENNARKKPPPPPSSKPPPPPKPIKVKGEETIPIHDAIRSVSGGTDSVTPVSTERSRSNEKAYAPVNTSTPRANDLKGPSPNPFDDDEEPVVHRPNPMRDFMANNKPRSTQNFGISASENPSFSSVGSSGHNNSSNVILENVKPGPNCLSDDAEQQHNGGYNSDPSFSSAGTGTRNRTKSVAHRSFKDMGPGEPNNMIYHKIRMSVTWLYVGILMILGQWALLLSVGHYALPSFVFALLCFLVIATVVLLIAARCLVKKSYLSDWRNVRLKTGSCTPDDEKDDIPDRAVYCVALAAVLQGIAYALFSAVTAGNADHLVDQGFYTQNVLLQVLRFTSITLLALHRVIRPANRIDPMRTMLELEVVSVCWDALDGSTLFQLLEDNSLGSSMDAAIRVLMAFWYVSVGCRMGIMLFTHLAPNSRGYKMVLMAPLQLAPQPTVDRTFQGLRLRATVTMVMSGAEFYAIVVRIILWARGQLSTLQQDMCIKNILFLMAFYNAYDMYTNTITREWNSRELGFGLRYPSRDTQLEYCRYGFVVTYILTSALLSSILIEVTPHADPWIANVVLDVILAVIFLIYCRNVHIQEAQHGPSWCCIPAKWFITFPAKLAFGINTAMILSLVGARVPALYYNYGNMADDDSSNYWTYDNSMLIVILSIVPIGMCGQFWSIAYMLFRREFTACPGNYNAIHDPTISMVAMATITEGALDVLSAAQLMALAANDLPVEVNGACVLFALLEIFNACQCFALQGLLSGGHDDTPMDLVKWKAYLRLARGVIDFGTFVLRIVLWVQYSALSSVFLVKNAYNLIHAFAQVERWNGVSSYPKGTLFSEFVPPADWYGMTKAEWREATSHTLAAQARAGRGV